MAHTTRPSMPLIQRGAKSLMLQCNILTGFSICAGILGCHFVDCKIWILTCSARIWSRNHEEIIKLVVKNCSAGGGTRKPIFPTPPLPAVPGGGVNSTSMAQNDTHVALIILTTQMGGGIIGGKNLFRAKFCVPLPSAPTSVLTQNKGPDAEPHFANPHPPPSAGIHVTPPPPPAEQFSGRPTSCCSSPTSRYGLWDMGYAASLTQLCFAGPFMGCLADIQRGLG